MRSRVSKPLVFLLALVWTLHICAQGAADLSLVRTSEFKSADEALQYYITRLQDERQSIPRAELAESFGASKMVQLIEQRLDEFSGRERQDLVSAMVYTAIDSQDTELRQRVVEFVLGDVLESPSKWGALNDLPSVLMESDFNSASRALLGDALEIVQENTGQLAFSDQVILAIGRAGIDEAVPRLKTIDSAQRVGDSSEVNPFAGRSALLALARLGDKAAVKEVIALLEDMQDPEARALNLQTLGYVRQPEVIEYLKSFLFSETVYDTKSRDVLPTSEPERASWTLGSMLEGFPVQGSIDEQRTWMNAQAKYTFKGIVNSQTHIANEDMSVDARGEGTPGQVPAVEDKSQGEVVPVENKSGLPLDGDGDVPHGQFNSTGTREDSYSETTKSDTGEIALRPDTPWLKMLGYASVLGLVVVFSIGVIYFRR